MHKLTERSVVLVQSGMEKLDLALEDSQHQNDQKSLNGSGSRRNSMSMNQGKRNSMSMPLGRGSIANITPTTALGMKRTNSFVSATSAGAGLYNNPSVGTSITPRTNAGSGDHTDVFSEEGTYSLMRTLGDLEGEVAKRLAKLGDNLHRPEWVHENVRDSLLGVLINFICALEANFFCDRRNALEQLNAVDPGRKRSLTFDSDVRGSIGSTVDTERAMNNSRRMSRRQSSIGSNGSMGSISIRGRDSTIGGRARGSTILQMQMASVDLATLALDLQLVTSDYA